MCQSVAEATELSNRRTDASRSLEYMVGASGDPGKSTAILWLVEHDLAAVFRLQRGVSLKPQTSGCGDPARSDRACLVWVYQELGSG